MINLYLLGEKGFIALKSLCEKDYILINKIIIGKDKDVLNDYSIQIEGFCEKNNLSYIISNKPTSDNNVIYSIAIGWRWILKLNSKLIVFHDSLLPKLRGFNPLVTSLINGDIEIGLSVLFGSENFDTGDLVIQKKVEIEYPIKIKKAIEIVGDLYGKALIELFAKINDNKLFSTKQDESFATYSLWRDEIDYKIDWSQSSIFIKRFIDSVGDPYKGALTFIGDEKVIVKDATVVDKDVVIENRTPGKVLFKNNNKFIIVCGKGLLCIENFYDSFGNNIDLKNFRIRFI